MALVTSRRRELRTLNCATHCSHPFCCFSAFGTDPSLRFNPFFESSALSSDPPSVAPSAPPAHRALSRLSPASGNGARNHHPPATTPPPASAGTPSAASPSPSHPAPVRCTACTRCTFLDRR